MHKEILLIEASPDYTGMQILITFTFSLQNNFSEGKKSLGEHHDLMEHLVKCKYTYGEEQSKAANAAMDQLSAGCDENAGIFQRLRVKYAHH